VGKKEHKTFHAGGHARASAQSIGLEGLLHSRDLGGKFKHNADVSLYGVAASPEEDKSIGLTLRSQRGRKKRSILKSKRVLQHPRPAKN